MTARIRAIRVGRTRALVQRPRRKAHIATIGAGETHWIGLCGREVLADGATFWHDDAAEHAESHADDVCSDCAWITALVGWVLDQQQTATMRREATR